MNTSRKKAIHKMANQSGFGMVEVLVSLIILLVGLLGLAGLMVQSQRSEMESYQRVQALILLQDMASRIDANRAVASCYAATTLGTGTVSSAIAINSNCTAQASYIPSDSNSPTTTAFCTTTGTCTYQCTPTTGSCPDTVSQPLASTLATNMAVQAEPTALSDLRAWNDLLNGAAETLGVSNAGAMVGARGCINYATATELTNPSTGIAIAGTGIYTVTVAWQGMGKTFSPPAALNCGAGLYGDETSRRVVSLTFRLGSLT